jgi:hypothetical protein
LLLQQEPKQIYVPIAVKENTNIVDIEVPSPKEGNNDTSNIITTPVPKLSTRILDNLDKITSSLRGESNCDSEMQLQAGSPVLESAVIASIQVVATEDLNFENPTRDNEPRQVEIVHAIELAKKPSVEPQCFTPDLRIVGSWSDAVTDADYIQDPPPWCGTTSSIVTASEAVINPHVAHDLEILRVWKDKEASNISHKVYTDEEENAAAINYLKNRPAAMEEPFTEVVSKAKKKNSHKGVNVHNTRARGKNRL